MREPQDTKRPITFVFNGGPGAASAYLHLGAIGPKIVEANAKGELAGPPSRLVVNDSSWLDFTDLVFVDPVGTGYSRVSDGKTEQDFFGVEQDTDSLADFIRLYLIDAERMASPVFLAGESYGGFRAATITRALQKSRGISPSGLVLISPALEFALLYGEDYDPLPWALALPSYAAVNLESQGVTGREGLAGALQDAERYPLGDYFVALASGAEQGRRGGERTGGATHPAFGSKWCGGPSPHTAGGFIRSSPPQGQWWSLMRAYRGPNPNRKGRARGPTRGPIPRPRGPPFGNRQRVGLKPKVRG